MKFSRGGLTNWALHPYKQLVLGGTAAFHTSRVWGAVIFNQEIVLGGTAASQPKPRGASAATQDVVKIANGLSSRL